MNNIGIVIKKYRNSLGLTRKELANNICSEKYIYLIEKNQRSPSVEFARLLSDKLSVDLFKYYYYLDCEDPINVCKYIEEFNRCRRTLGFELMIKATQEAEKMKDFEHKPWSYEVYINKLILDIFNKFEYRKSIASIKKSLSKIDHKYSESIYIVYLNFLLSTCYKHIGEFDNASEAITIANEIMQKKQRSAHDEQLLLFVEIGVMVMDYHNKDYDKVIEMCRLKENDTFRINAYGVSHFIFFYMAFAYYEQGHRENSIMYFKKGLHSVVVYEKKIDMSYISRLKTFEILISDKNISQDLVNEYKEKYDYFL